MKILFFTNEYSHQKLPSSGGVGSFIKIIAQELLIQGHEVCVYGFSKKKHEFQDGSVKVKFFKKYAKQFPFSEFLRSLSKSLKIKSSEMFFLKKERQYLANQLKKYALKNNIDIIESFVFGGYTSQWDNTIPLVLRFHGSRGFWHYYLGQKKEAHLIHLEQIALENTPYTIAVSEFSAVAVKDMYNLEVDKIIYNGIDIEQFSPQDNVDELEQSIFYFGTISKAKGIDILCQVFNDVIKKYPKTTLHLIGRGNDYWDEVSSQILSKEAKNNATYYGAKQIDELPRLVQQATVCVFPSLNETFGLIVTEAMALEKVVIVSDIPSFNNIIKHTEDGFIAKKQEDYVSYISEMFNNYEDRKRIGKAARDKVNNNFTIQKMTESTITYYQSILNKN